MINQEPEEIWKPVDGYEGIYEVSISGEVKCLSKIVKHWRGGVRNVSEKQFKLTADSHGYVCISLHKNSKLIRKKVHRLVAVAFCPNPNNKPFVNHKNGIKTDNRAENLEWVTSKENIIHSWENGISKSSVNQRAASSKFCKGRVGEKGPMSKLKEPTVIAILRLYRMNPKFNRCQVAKKLNINPGTVYKIIKRQRWCYLSI